MRGVRLVRRVGLVRPMRLMRTMRLVVTEHRPVDSRPLQNQVRGSDLPTICDCRMELTNPRLVDVLVSFQAGRCGCTRGDGCDCGSEDLGGLEEFALGHRTSPVVLIA